MKTFKEYYNKELLIETNIILPLKSTQAMRDYMRNNNPEDEDPEEEVEITHNDKKVTIKNKEWSDKKYMADQDMPHEYIHAVQINDTDMFQGLEDIDLETVWANSSDEQFIKYFSRPPEIMAHHYY